MLAMKQFAFILGNHPELSRAEIMSLIPDGKIIAESKNALILECAEINAEKILDRLGGTIKIGETVEKNDVTPETPACQRLKAQPMAGRLIKIKK